MLQAMPGPRVGQLDVAWATLDPYPDCRALSDLEFERFARTVDEATRAVDDAMLVGCVAGSGVDCFNAGLYDRAARLFGVAAPARRRIEEVAGGARHFEGTVTISDLDPIRLGRVARDPTLRQVALAILRYFAAHTAEQFTGPT